MHLSTNRIKIAYRRTLEELGITEADHDCPLFRESFGNHLSKVYAEDTLAEMESQGIISVVDVDAKGERVWNMTQAKAA